MSAGRRRSRALDPRLWIGLAVTAATLWLALRDVSFADVARDVARADLVKLLAIAVPANVLAIVVRARRWRHLTDAIAPVPQGPLFRATAIGFMANNLFPLRAGEFIRAWLLARDARLSAAAVLATVVLERVIDSISFVVLVALLLAAGAARGDGALGRAALPLALAAFVPLGGLLLLRARPEWLIGLFERVAGLVLPARVTRFGAELMRRFAEGLGSLRGGTHLLWIVLDTAVLWGGLLMLPFLAGLWALGIDLGGLGEALIASYVTMIAVGVAIAIPSAPGFFGPYHLACREALHRFGVPESEALALGTLVHATFWVTVTALGLAVLHRGRTSLGALQAAAEAEGEPAVAGIEAPPASRGKAPGPHRR